MNSDLLYIIYILRKTGCYTRYFLVKLVMLEAHAMISCH